MDTEKDPWQPTRDFFQGLADLREAEARLGHLKLYKIKNPPVPTSEAGGQSDAKPFPTSSTEPRTFRK